MPVAGWGLPRALHADNGPDFTSAALRRGCDEYGIKLILRPVATPHYGGHIERLIGTIMGRVHLLPGTTGSNPQDKGAYPAESEAVLTMAELERWLAIEICEQYHQRVHGGLRRTPGAAWQDALRQADGGLGPLPDKPEQFAWSFLPFERRTLRRDGLHLFNIRYWDSVGCTHRSLTGSGTRRRIHAVVRTSKSCRSGYSTKIHRG